MLAFAAAYSLGDLSLEGGFVINVVHERFHALLFCITVGLHQSLQFHPGAVILLFLKEVFHVIIMLPPLLVVTPFVPLDFPGLHSDSVCIILEPHRGVVELEFGTSLQPDAFVQLSEAVWSRLFPYKEFGHDL